MQIGNVTRVDRAAQSVEVAVTGAAVPITAKYGDSKRPPAPLGVVSLEQVAHAGWVVRDELSVRDLVFHEDFLIVVQALNVLQADSYWIIGNNLGTVTQSTLAGGAGCALLTTQATFAQPIDIRKDTGIVLDDTKALWLSMQVALDDPTNVSTSFQLVGSGRFAEIDYSTSGTSRYQITSGDGIGSATAETPYTPATRALHVLDLVLHAGRFAAAWVDGDGPYACQTNLPLPGDAVQLQLSINNLVAATRGLYVDWVHVEQFTNPVHPERLFDLAVG